MAIRGEHKILCYQFRVVPLTDISQMYVQKLLGRKFERQLVKLLCEH